MLNTADVFQDLCRSYNVTPDRQGEAWVMCPACGATPREKKFSFSVNGGAHCFRCGYNTNVTKLAGIERPVAPVRETPIKPRPQPRDWTALAHQCAQRPEAARLWQAYKPLHAETIRRMHLGLGVLPDSHCHHERLLVPLFRNSRVVGIRGRVLHCEHAKWLSPLGSQMVLYNAESVRIGEPLVIVENPIDALLVGQGWGMAAVATLGVSIWTDDYTALLKAQRPSQIICSFDNDVPGQTTDPAIIARWKAARRARGLPDDETKFLSGIKLTNRLLAAGLPAELYRWPANAPEHADIGSLFAEAK